MRVHACWVDALCAVALRRIYEGGPWKKIDYKSNVHLPRPRKKAATWASDLLLKKKNVLKAAKRFFVIAFLGVLYEV
jgi:hypothetical protein